MQHLCPYLKVELEAYPDDESTAMDELVNLWREMQIRDEALRNVHVYEYLDVDEGLTTEAYPNLQDLSVDVNGEESDKLDDDYESDEGDELDEY